MRDQVNLELLHARQVHVDGSLQTVAREDELLESTGRQHEHLELTAARDFKSAEVWGPQFQRLHLVHVGHRQLQERAGLKH